MPKKRRTVKKSLRSKGFVVEKKGRDHDYFFFVYDRKKTPVFTKVSRGTKHRTIGDSLLGHMSRQLHLSRRDFDNLVDCPLDRPEYVEKLRAKGIID